MQRLTTFAVTLLFLGFGLWAGTSAAQIPGLSSTTSATAGSGDTANLDDLIKILENDETRAKLVESLKAAAYKAPEDEGTNGAAQPGGAPVIGTLPGEIAASTRALIGGVAETWGNLRQSASSALAILAGAGAIDLPNVLVATLPVGLVAIVVFLVLAASRLLKTPIFRRLAAEASQSGPVRKLLLLLLSALVDAVSIVGSWAAGYVAATIFFGGRPGLNQALFLNGFLLIEMIKVALGTFVAPTYPKLRLTPFSDRQASYWYFWISRLISILGYTFLFVAPIVQQSSSVAAADATRLIGVVLSLFLAVGLILKNRGIVRERLKRAKHHGDKSFGARFNAFIGQVWWILAIGFVLALFVVWLQSPDSGLSFVVTATLKSIGAMALGGLIVSILSRIIAKGIPIPQGWRERIPLLERRVNAFIPKMLTVVRVVVVLIVLGVILESWHLFSFRFGLGGLLSQRVMGSLIGAGVILAIGVAFYIGVSSWIEYRMNPNFGSVPTARERTLLSLFRNAFTITMVVIVSMLVLSQIGIDIAPLLAGAGVVGLAIGFGAQKFVQDIITGAFIQIQNAMNEGDIVELNGVSGVVEQLTVRSVGLRTVDGTWYLIPFSSVDQVANYSKDFAYYVADIGVAYRENVEDVKQMMHDAFEELKESSVGANLISDLDMWGVQELGDSAVVVRARVMTKPSTQWGVGRAYREIVKRLADDRGIEIPFPHMTVWFGEDRAGKAPPVRIAAEEMVAPGRRQIDAAPRSSDAGRATQETSGSDYGSTDAAGHPIPPSDSDIDSAGGDRG